MPRGSKVLGRGLLAGVAVAFIIAAFWSLWLARADLLFRHDTTESVTEASELTPGNATYHARLAELDDSRQRVELEKAIADNPYDSDSWMRLGLIAESEGDFALAERRLLESERVNRAFAPRWTLAGYYFRRGDETNFWIWARKAVEMSYGDATALYRLCWRVSDDPLKILETAIPPEEDHLVRYLLFLIAEERFDAGIAATRRLIPIVSEQHHPVVLGFCDRLIERRKVSEAVAVWNAITAYGLVPHGALSPDNGRSLTNGDFRFAPIGRAFDWRLLPADGVTVSTQPGQVALSFTGSQAEHCELLLQYLPLAQRSVYRMTYTFSMTQRGPSGLRWQVLDSATNQELAPLDDLVAAGKQLAQRSLYFRTGEYTNLGRITLRYDEKKGSPDLSGTVIIHEVELISVR